MRIIVTNYFEIHKYRSYGPNKLGRMDRCTHIDESDVLASMSCSPQAGLTRKSTEAISKDDDTPQQLFAKKLILVKDYQPGVTCLVKS